LNLANMRRMDSACLGEIVESYKTAASNGAVLKLAEIGPDLQAASAQSTLLVPHSFRMTQHAQV